MEMELRRQAAFIVDSAIDSVRAENPEYTLSDNDRVSLIIVVMGFIQDADLDYPATMVTKFTKWATDWLEGDIWDSLESNQYIPTDLLDSIADYAIGEIMEFYGPLIPAIGRELERLLEDE